MHKFTADITKDKASNWKCLVWEDSVKELGTGKSVKVEATIDGHSFHATLLPIGGLHMLPLRATVIKQLKKDVGDTVKVDIVTV